SGRAQRRASARTTSLNSDFAAPLRLGSASSSATPASVGSQPPSSSSAAGVCPARASNWSERRESRPSAEAMALTTARRGYAGRYIGRLAWYALLGLFAASLGQVVGVALSLPEPLMIGDVNVLAASAPAVLLLSVARARGF